MPLLDFRGYTKDGEERPLRSYALLTLIYNALFAAFLLLVRRRRKLDELTSQATVGNLLLLGVATHKLSRLISKDWVTSPIRAPFTTYEEPASASEVSERPRGHGMQLALGELLT